MKKNILEATNRSAIRRLCIMRYGCDGRNESVNLTVKEELKWDR